MRSPEASALAVLAAKQSGVFSPAQARHAGFSHYRVRQCIARGEWVALYGGRALRSAHAILDGRGLDRAALLATGARSMLGGPSAARWWNIDVPWPEPFVLVPSTSRREPAGISVRRGIVADVDVMFRDGVLLTSRPCTIVDCLRVVPIHVGVTLLDRALQQKWLSFDDLVWRTQQLAGRPGVANSSATSAWHNRGHARRASEPWPASCAKPDSPAGARTSPSRASASLTLPSSSSTSRDRDRRAGVALGRRPLPVRSEPAEQARSAGLDGAAVHLGRPRRATFGGNP